MGTAMLTNADRGDGHYREHERHIAYLRQDRMSRDESHDASMQPPEVGHSRKRVSTNMSCLDEFIHGASVQPHSSQRGAMWMLRDCSTTIPECKITISTVWVSLCQGQGWDVMSFHHSMHYRLEHSRPIAFLSKATFHGKQALPKSCGSNMCYLLLS